MTNGEIATIGLAGLALVLAAIMAVLLFTSVRSRTRAPSPNAAQVGVRLVPSAGTGLGYWWRFETAEDAPPTEVVIFSFRSHGADNAAQWHHELMDAPLVLTPSQPAYLRAPALATAGAAYDVSLGWTIQGADGDTQGSTIVTIQPELFSSLR